MSEMSYEVVEEYGVISESQAGWTTEFNLVSFNGGAPKYDLRSWSPDKEKMSKGIRFSKEELKQLKSLIDALDL